MIEGENVTMSASRYLQLLEYEKIVDKIRDNTNEVFIEFQYGYLGKTSIKTKDEVIKSMVNQLKDYKEIVTNFSCRQDKLEKAFVKLHEDLKLKK